MDIVPIIIPVITSYIVSNYCPFTPQFDTNIRTESQGEKIARENVWPVLSGTIGFAWYFARNKAIAAQAAKATTKGTRKAVGKLGKLLQGSHRYALDFAFLILIFFVNWWIYLYSCNKHYKDAFLVLIGTIGCIAWVIYLTSSYTSASLLLLTPLLLWLLVTAQSTGKQYYYSEIAVEATDTNGVTNGGELLPQVPENDNDPEKANLELAEEEKDVKEQFRIW